MGLANQIGNGILAAAAVATRKAAGLASHTVDVDGLTIAYDRSTDRSGETIILLHGFSAEREVWGRFAANLKGYDLVIPDLAGHGHTRFRAGAGYSAPAQADRVLALATALGVERFHVIGNSMGGFIAAWTAIKGGPDRVRSLGLVDAAGLQSSAPSVLDGMLESGENPFLMERVEQFESFYAMTMAKMPVVPGVVKQALAQNYVDRRDELAEIFADFHKQDLLSGRLGEITVPTWICWGRHDQLIHLTAATQFDEGIPNSSLTVYDDLGHMPMFEAPKRTATDYAAFLATVPPAR